MFKMSKMAIGNLFQVGPWSSNKLSSHFIFNVFFFGTRCSGLIFLLSYSILKSISSTSPGNF